MGGSSSRFGEPEKKLRCPGQFERLHDDVKKVTSVNTFEGAKFEVAKPLTPTFAVNHNFWLGGSYYPNANRHYKFGATVGDNERVCMASVDQYGTLEGQFYGALVGAFQGKFIFNLPKDPKGFVAVCDADYGGKDASAQLKVARNVHGVAGNHLGVAYMQAVTPALSVGGEGHVACAGPSSSLTAAAKYGGDKWVGVLAATRAAGAAADSFVASYARVVSPNRVSVGAELNASPGAGGDALMTCGAEFNLKQSRICVAVDGNGKMQSICEATLSPAAKLTFSAEMLLGMAEEPGKHRDQFKFGYALQIGQ